MFEKASRLQLRFNFKGVLTTEDLWSLSLKDLDTIFKNLNASAKLQKEESLLDTRSAEDALTDLKLEIVKHIVSVKLQEQKERELAAEKKARKQQLMEVLEKKQSNALNDLSVEDLQKAIAELS